MDGSTYLAIAVVSALCAVIGAVGTIGGGAVFLVKAAMFVGEMKAAAKSIAGMEASLDKIPSLETHVSLLSQRVDRLEGRHDSTRAHAIRAEAISQHHIGE